MFRNPGVRIKKSLRQRHRGRETEREMNGGWGGEGENMHAKYWVLES